MPADRDASSRSPLPRSPSPARSAVSPVISVAELSAALRSPHRPVLLDVRWSLTGDGYPAFLAGRIPGAVFVDLDRELAAAPGIGGRHPLPAIAGVRALAARAGIGEDTPVVVCGQRDTSIAARAWWLLRWAGYDAVRVLDGGFAAWADGGASVESGQPPAGRGIESVPAAPPAPADVATDGVATVDADGAAALGAAAPSAGMLLDARAGERYRGEIEPIDPVAGHIPGAVNVPLSEVHDADGHLRPAGELRDVFAAAGVRDGVPAAASCGSGVTACSLILAAEVAGLHLALYPGSYSGWCALGRPVEQGEA